MNKIKSTRLVALEWDEAEARLVVATQKGRQLRLRAVARVALPEGAEVEATLQPALRALLDQHRVGRGECLLAVGRSAVELKHLALPPSPDEELPELVRFQALREFAAIGDDWPVDYLPLDHDATQPRHVLAAALNPSSIARLRATCETLNLEVQSIVLRPCGLASLVARRFALEAGEAYLLIDPLEKQMDLAVLEGESIVMLRCARADCAGGEESLSATLSEVRRTIAMATNRLHGKRFSRVYLCGGGPAQSAFAARLESEFNLPVQMFDPLSDLEFASPTAGGPEEDRCRYAPLVGMLLDAADGKRQAIDFLSPRQKAVAPSRRRPAIFAAAAVAALVLMSGLWFWQQLRDLDAEIVQLAAESRALDDLVKRGQEIEKKAGEIDKWAASNLDWLSELHRLSTELPPAEEVWITQFRAGPRPTGGELQLEGLVNNAGAISLVEKNLRGPRHTVEHKAGQQSDKHPRYRWSFKSAVLIDAPSETIEERP